MNKKNGFSLIELLVVITLIGLIFSIIIPISLNFFKKRENDQKEMIKNEILVAAKKYYYDNANICGTYNSCEISIDKLVDYIELDNEHFNNDKIIDPTNEENCFNGGIIVNISGERVDFSDSNLTTSICD